MYVYVLVGMLLFYRDGVTYIQITQWIVLTMLDFQLNQPHHEACFDTMYICVLLKLHRSHNMRHLHMGTAANESHMNAKRKENQCHKSFEIIKKNNILSCIQIIII